MFKILLITYVIPMLLGAVCSALLVAHDLYNHAGSHWALLVWSITFVVCAMLYIYFYRPF